MNQKHHSASHHNASHHPIFNYEDHVKELKERFARLIWSLGPNRGKGTKRYDYEVDFAYALNDLEQGPPYLRGKLFEKANAVANSLVAFIKTMRPEDQPQAA